MMRIFYSSLCKKGEIPGLEWFLRENPLLLTKVFFDSISQFLIS